MVVARPGAERKFSVMATTGRPAYRPLAAFLPI
jgi:hypothetical protein